MITLEENSSFSSGGNRLCFRHPNHGDRCLKVLRSDRTPEIRRKQKNFPANLRSLNHFDENWIEYKTLEYLHNAYTVAIQNHLPKTFGLVETNLGFAHETSLIIDHDGLISVTLEQYIWSQGVDLKVEQALRQFKTAWKNEFPHTRDLIPHNIVAQDNGQELRLILIDGLGRRQKFLNFHSIRSIAEKRCERRIKNLDQRIQRLLDRKKTNDAPTQRLENLKR